MSHSRWAPPAARSTATVPPRTSSSPPIPSAPPTIYGPHGIQTSFPPHRARDRMRTPIADSPGCHAPSSRAVDDPRRMETPRPLDLPRPLGSPSATASPPPRTPPPPPAPRVESAQVNATLDAYGFKRQTSGPASVAVQMHFERQALRFRPAQARRWEALMRPDLPPGVAMAASGPASAPASGTASRLDEAGETTLRGTLPPKSERVKRAIRKGIPPALRPRAWFYYSGAEAEWADNPGLYLLLLCREQQDRRDAAAKRRSKNENDGTHQTTPMPDEGEEHGNEVLRYIGILERDLERTFPDNVWFSMPADRETQAEDDPAASIWGASRKRPAGPSGKVCTAAIGTCAAAPPVSAHSLTVDSNVGKPAESPSDEGSDFESARLISSPTLAGFAGPPNGDQSPRLSAFNASHLGIVDPMGSAASSLSAWESTEGDDEGEDGSEGIASGAMGSSLTVSDAPFIQSLRRILVAFAYYSWPLPDTSRDLPRHCTYRIGYCQSLNFIVGALLLVMTHGRRREFMKGINGLRTHIEEQVFWILVVIVEKLLPTEMYGTALEGAIIEQEVLWKYVFGERANKFGVEEVGQWIQCMENGLPLPATKAKSASGSRYHGPPSASRRNGFRSGLNSKRMSQLNAASFMPRDRMPPLSMVTTQWFMTLFVTALPTETWLRVWDAFLYQGEKVLMRVALTLVKLHEDTIVRMTDPMTGWKFLKGLPHTMWDTHGFLKACFQPRVAPFGSETAVRAPLQDSQDDDHEDSAATSHLGLGQASQRTGVGSVSRRMLEHYRERARADRMKS